MTARELVNKLLMVPDELLVYYPGDGGGLDPVEVVGIDRRGFVLLDREDVASGGNP